MKILVLHISDIHIKNQHNLASDRFRLVLPAIRYVESDVTTVLVVASGDIAFSGDPDEYAIATKDWTDLIQELKKEFTNAAVHFIAVPGNHDCNFRGNQKLREVVINSVRDDNVSFDEQLIETCATVQRGYREFLKAVPEYIPDKSGGIAHSYHEIKADPHTILVRCYNTALTSTNPEQPAQLTYPLSVLGKNEPKGKYDYVISIFHHPYNWLQPITGRRFREHVERTSDLILTGHEHESSSYRKYSYKTDGENDYLEGAVFQESDDPDTSGFNAVWIDMVTQRQKLRGYTWNGTIYEPQERDQWTPWTKGARLATKDFQIADDFEDELEDPGAKFEHPARPSGLRLEDIYVFPAVKEVVIDGKQKTEPTQPRIEGRELLKRLTSMPKTLITGRERSGKSTLAKILFHEFYRKGSIPIMLTGDDITPKTIEIEEFQKLVKAKLQIQYTNPKLPLFERLGKDQIVIILDDFDHARVNPKGRLKLLDTIQQRFNRIFVLSDSFIQFEELAYGDLGTAVLESYHQLELQEFGHFLRTKIIEQWYAIGSEYASDPEAIDRKIETACNLIDSFLDKSYLPAYPIFILTFLQAIDSAQPLNTSAGSYGHIYEVLVTKALATGDKAFNIDTKANYLAEMAYWMFNHQTRELSEPEYRLFHAKYEEKYGIRLNSQHLFETLRNSAILAGGGQEFRFKYPYYYYYFVARLFRDNIQNQNVKEQIKGLLTNLHKEDHSNIWILLTHLSKDPFLVDSIIEHSKKLFSEILPSEFGNDIQFLQGFYALIPKIVLEDKSPEEVREIRRRQMEEDHKENQKLLSEEGKGEELVALITKLNAAFRTIEVLGQIVRNFPGSIVGETKCLLVKECYELGLRIMGFFFNLWREGGQDIVTQVVDLILDKNPTLENKEELKNKIKTFLFTFLEMLAFNMVKRISHAVGATALAATYEAVVEKMPTRAVKLIDISVKLDTIGMPKKEMFELFHEMKDNIFCQELLRLLTVHHFYLFHTDHKIKQAVCQELGIEFKKLSRAELSRTGQKRLTN